MFRGSALALVGLCAMATSIARADDVLHEFVPDVDPDEGAAALLAHEPNPEAIVYNGEVVEAPARESLTSSPSMVARAGDGLGPELPGQRSPIFRPDRKTDLEGTLEYYEVFSPAIAPFKRVTSLDLVFEGPDGMTPVLGVKDATLRPVAIERPDAPAPDPRPRDRFFGAVKLDFSSGSVVPLPSVSPESRLLSLETEPRVELAIKRDSADAFFAALKGPAPKEPVFVRFLTDAPRAYFGAALPHAPLASLASDAPVVPAGIRARALGFAKQLGIGPSSELSDALARLTAHFRAFEESSEPPKDTGDIYLDLARAKKGICRHRVYAFVVTAQALGIPARFVQNEAHSFAEVKLPRIGWMRIDLGGAAHGLTAHDAGDRPRYQPAEPDPLPRPPAYEASYSLLGRDVKGLRRPGDAELQGRWVAPDKEAPGAQAQEKASFMSGPNPRAPRDTLQRAPLSLVLDQRHQSVLRGQELAVSGRVRNAAGQGVPGLRIEVSLASAARPERMLLGVTATTESGGFAARFGIPPDLATGDYQLVVVTPGNEHYAPAVAE